MANQEINIRELASKAGVDTRVAQSFVNELRAGLPAHVLARTEPRRRLLVAAEAMNSAALSLASTPKPLA